MLKSIRLLSILLTVGLAAPAAGCAERPGPKKGSAKKKAEIKKAREDREKKRKEKKEKAAKDADAKAAERQDAPTEPPKTGDAAKSEDEPAEAAAK